MKLAEAVRVTNIPRLALVGAGGKTTALLQLARDLNQPVMVTATTHLAKNQLSLADHHFLVESGDDVTALVKQSISGVTLLTGPEAGDKRMLGVEPDVLERILDLVNIHKLPLLLEADGSRRLPLKGPAENEPAIPVFDSAGRFEKWLDAVVVVAGLSGLGEPLTPDWVHRPERFSELSGLNPGEPITPEGLARVLLHPKGGLKNIPSGTRRIALLNQADTPELQAQALRIIYGSPEVGSLLSSYHAAIVASLESNKIYAVHEPVAGIILAAGKSSRFGEPKQLLIWQEESFIHHVARKALAAGLSPVVVVSGAYSLEVQRAVEDLEVSFVHNPYWEQGQSTSVKAGLGALPEGIGAAIFQLVDQPQIPVDLLHKLVEIHAGTLSPLIAPQVDGRRANPVLFDRTTFPNLMKLTGDVGGRKLFSKYPITWIPWLDHSVLIDVDSPEDYHRLLDFAFPN